MISPPDRNQEVLWCFGRHGAKAGALEKARALLASGNLSCTSLDFCSPGPPPCSALQSGVGPTPAQQVGAWSARMDDRNLYPEALRLSTTPNASFVP